MDRGLATKFLRDKLDEFNLSEWKIRLNTSSSAYYLGLCSYKDKTIILNAHHIDQHPEEEIKDTILHEVAHALCPDEGHNSIWSNKAKEIGCTNTSPCAMYSISEEIKDAIRSGAQLEISFETEVIRKPTAKITQLFDLCPFCQKRAEEVSFKNLEIQDESKPNLRFIKLKCGHTIIKQIPKGIPYGKLVSNWYENRVKSCQHEFIKNQCIHCKEFKLFNFQIEGARFTEIGIALQNGTLIADVMGLGKTIQALAYLHYHQESFPVLFVVKSRTKFQWFKEVIRWLGLTHTAQIIEGSQDFIIPNLKCYIASWDVFTPRMKKGKSYIFNIDNLNHITTVILDEVQQIKNVDSTRTQQIRKVIKGKKVIGLSGTPWKNRGSEYFTILNILAPSKFPSYAAFIKNWVDVYYDGQYTKQGGIKNIPKFKEFIKDICIRREIEEVMDEMPSVNRNLYFTDLDKVTQSEYNDSESDFVKWWNEKVIGGEEDLGSNDINILGKMAQMRHITGLAKIEPTIEWVREFYNETDRKLVIFVHHKDVGEILLSRLNEEFGKDIVIEKITANQSPLESFQSQERFNNAKRSFMVASTLAAGEGLNLQSCGDALLHERQWNPANEEQAAPGRFRRIGSVHNVINVIYMTAAGTIDELLGNIVERKREWFESVMSKDYHPDSHSEKFSLAKDLAEAIVKNHNKKDKGKLTQMASLK